MKLAAHSVASISFFSATRSNVATVMSPPGSRAVAAPMRSSAARFCASSSARKDSADSMRDLRLPVESRHPARDARQDFPRDGPRALGDLVGPYRVLAERPLLATQHDDLVALGRAVDVRDVDHRHIHRNRPDDGRTLAAD